MPSSAWSRSASSFWTSASASLTLPARIPKSRLYLNPMTGPDGRVVQGVDDVGVLQPVPVRRVRQIAQEADEEERVALACARPSTSRRRASMPSRSWENSGPPGEGVLHVQVHRREGLHVLRQRLVRRARRPPPSAGPSTFPAPGWPARCVLSARLMKPLELAALGAEPVEVDVGRVPALDEPLGARDRLVDLIAHLEQERADGLGGHHPPVRLLHAERDLGALDVDAGLRRPDAVLGGHAGVLDEAPREDRLDDADRASHEGAGDVRRVLVVGGGDLVAAGPGRGPDHGLDARPAGGRSRGPGAACPGSLPPRRAPAGPPGSGRARPGGSPPGSAGRPAGPPARLAAREAPGPGLGPGAGVSRVAGGAGPARAEPGASTRPAAIPEPGAAPGRARPYGAGRPGCRRAMRRSP